MHAKFHNRIFLHVLRVAVALLFSVLLSLPVSLVEEGKHWIRQPPEHWPDLKQFGLFPLFISSGVGMATWWIRPAQPRFHEGFLTGLIFASLPSLVLMGILRSAHGLTAERMRLILISALPYLLVYALVGAATEYLVILRVNRRKEVS